MKELIEYTDYRAYISDYYADKKSRYAFTWREFAKNAGFSSPVYLKLVVEGKHNLSEVAVERVAQAMNLAGYEMQYFRAMVKFCHAKDDEGKRAAFSEMISVAEGHKGVILEGDAFKFFSDWKNPVIRELAPAMPGAKPLDIAHACRQKISAAEVSETLGFLTKADLLEKDGEGRYHQTDKFVTTGPMEVTPLAVRGMHQQMGEFALETIEGVPQDERNFSGVTLGLTRKAYEQIVKEIAEFRRKVISIATSEDGCDEVYRLNMQLFPMTRKSAKK